MHSFLREINAETRQLSWRITSKCESEPGINFPGFFNVVICIDFLHLTILKMKNNYNARREVEQWLKKVQVHLAGSKIIQIRY